MTGFFNDVTSFLWELLRNFDVRHYMTQITYNTPSWAVSDLQSPPPRALRALGIGDCKSDTALLGVL